MVPKGLGLRTSPPCVLREAGQRCQKIGRPRLLAVTWPLPTPNGQSQGYTPRTRLLLSWVEYILFHFMGMGYILENITKHFLNCKMELIAHLSHRLIVGIPGL